MLQKEEEETMRCRREEGRNEMKSNKTQSGREKQRERKGVFLKDPKIDILSILSSVRSSICVAGVMSLLSMIPFDAYGRYRVSCRVSVSFDEVYESSHS